MIIHIILQKYIFPPSYCVFRKDRCEGAGGVFICIKENLSASAIPSLNTDAEIIGAKIDISKRNPIFICSFIDPLTIYYSHF